ncbi:MAG: sigma 54-interacting transcriptional regulator [Clostridia bacterium]|jgi:transcriptional regulator with PAS, ATPase and Fis domain|nr:sigma 54-interacting transcriptional regulator [Clostridia bacterium]
MSTFRLRIEFEDRTKMVLDTSKAIAKYDLNITALEVLPNLMYFELQHNNGDDQVKQKLILDLASIPNILKVEEVKYSPHLIDNDNAFSSLIGESEGLRKAVFQAKLVAKSSCTVLIQGESGTGKDLLAKAIHLASERGTKPFYPINCAAFPESLLESELFGYEEGTFSGALKGGKAGLFEVASGSTLFLDEVGDLSLNTQAKLLRVLQEKKIRRIGGYKEKEVDVRIIAATNRNLLQMVQKGEFRHDLYYRLNVVPIEIPALRHRRADIPLLAEYFLAKYAQRTSTIPKTLTARALAYLINYDWPGNVRELENMIERAINLTPGLIIDIESLHFEKENYISLLPDEGKPLKTLVRAYEGRLIDEAVKKHGSIRKAAKALGLSHTGLLKKLKNLQKQVPRDS